MLHGWEKGAQLGINVIHCRKAQDCLALQVWEPELPRCKSLPS